jgi:glycerophosphoryl diester phosphodiesterase
LILDRIKEQARMEWMKRFLLIIICAAGMLAQSKRIAVIAHRGEHLHHPENTLAAFEGAVDAGADYFELDVRTSSDGKLVLMHDATVDRMTGGKGEVAKMTFEDLRKLEVGVNLGPGFPGTRIPTFDEALAFAHGKIGVYVDSKQISAADAVAAVKRNDMEDHVVVYGNPDYLKQVGALSPRMRLMPEARNPGVLRSLLDAMRLEVAAFDASDFNDETIQVARSAKVAIYVDRLGAADNPSGWQDAIDRGAAGIQTDHPAELVQYLKSKGILHGVTLP